MGQSVFQCAFIWSSVCTAGTLFCGEGRLDKRPYFQSKMYTAPVFGRRCNDSRVCGMKLLYGPVVQYGCDRSSNIFIRND